MQTPLHPLLLLPKGAPLGEMQVSLLGESQPKTSLRATLQHGKPKLALDAS